MKKVGIIGHFAFGKNLLNGQTIKTKIVCEELEKRYSTKEIKKSDTSGGVKKLISMPFKVLKLFFGCKNVIMLPAHNGLKILAPLFDFYNSIFNRTIHYIVIGGWLPEFIEKHTSVKKALKKFDFIYVETNAMKQSLNDQGLNNAIVMNNFKNISVLTEDEIVCDHKKPYKFCTFSRVSKEKGIEDAIEAITCINNKSKDIVCTLDIYGSVDSGYEQKFDEIVKNLPEYIRYCGCVDSDKSTSILKDYYALLFPTFYAGEGFAGTLIDAFSSAIPVIASDWRYNSEIVEDGYNGYIFKHCDVQMLSDTIEKIISDGKKYYELKKNSLLSANKYLPNVAIEPLIKNIECHR